MAPGTPGAKGDENRGLSVKFISEGLFKDLDIDGSESVHKIEPKIRGKGEKTLCPRDGREGAAYVDVAPDDLAGSANLMLSYTWKYSLSKIKSSLERYCGSKGKRFEDTRVWICCFCVNQHRVQEALDNKTAVTTNQFREVFQKRLRAAGNVVGLLSPWRDPEYVKRVWCLFEAWESTRIEGRIQLDFVLPKEDEIDFLDELTAGGLNTVNDVLSKIDCLNADAYLKQDKENILKLIEEESDSRHCTGYEKLNMAIKVRLQEWFTRTAADELQQRETFNSKLGLEVADLYTRLGKNRECKELVSEMLNWCAGAKPDDPEKGLKVQSRLRLRLARNYGNAGQQKDSLKELIQAERLELSARKNPNVAEEEEAGILRSYGAVYRKLGDLEKSFDYYAKALRILEASNGGGHQIAAGWILLNLGLVQSLLQDEETKGSKVRAYSSADCSDLSPGGGSWGSSEAKSPDWYFDRAEEIYRMYGRTKFADFAWLLKNRGDVYLKAHRYDDAEKAYEAANNIHKTLGRETIENHGELMKSMGVLHLKRAQQDDDDVLKAKQLTKATQYFERAREIQRFQLTPEEALVESLGNLSSVYKRRGDKLSAEAVVAMAQDAEDFLNLLERTPSPTKEKSVDFGELSHGKFSSEGRASGSVPSQHSLRTDLGSQSGGGGVPKAKMADEGDTAVDSSLMQACDQIRSYLREHDLLKVAPDGRDCIRWRVLKKCLSERAIIQSAETQLFHELSKAGILHCAGSLSDATVDLEGFLCWLRGGSGGGGGAPGGE